MQKISRLGSTWLQVLLVGTPAMLAVFGFVCIAFLLIGQFKTQYAVPVGVLGAGLVLYAVWVQQQKQPFYKRSKEMAIFSALALVFAVVWTGFNLNYNSEHVFINRDPGTYTVTAGYLQNNSDLNIPKVSGFNESDGFFSSSAGFDTSAFNPSELFAQGAHLLPSLLGLLARFVGIQAIFNGNVIFGGLALLAFFAFCINFLRPWLSLLAMVSLSLLLPFIYFSRDTYSEILALLFTFGALTLLYHAVFRKSTVLCLIAGLALGAGAMTRIDAFLVIAAIILFAGSYVVLQKTKRDRKLALTQLTWFGLGTTLTALIGFLDVRELASGYFITEWHNISKELFLIAGLLIAFVAVVAWFSEKGRVAYVDRLTKGWRAWVLAIAILLFWIVMAMRHRWMNNPETIEELTVFWLAAYLGPIMLSLGILGTSYIGYKVFSSKDDSMKLLPLFAVVMTTAVLYVTKPNISPDQVWASRRVLPIVLPGLIFAGVFLVDRCLTFLAKRTKAQAVIWHRPAVIATVIVATFSPIALSGNYLTLSPFKEFDALSGICRELPKKSVIIWLGRAASETTMATRVFCHVGAVRYGGSGAISARLLAKEEKKAEKSGEQLVVGLFERDENLLPADKKTTRVANKHFQNIELARRDLPISIDTGDEKILLGLVEKNGVIKELQ